MANPLEGLASVTAQGDSLFSKPFGSQTSWRTKNGCVTLKFLFDNMAGYDQTYLLASLTDWVAELRKQLCRQLLEPKDIVSEELTLEEITWQAYQKMNPRILAQFMQDSKFKEGYQAYLTKGLAEQYKEEELLKTALTTRDFDFSLRIAIDAYPQSKHLPSDVKLEPGEKQGVLIFRLEGRLGHPPTNAVSPARVDSMTPTLDTTPQTKKTVKTQKVAEGDSAPEHFNKGRQAAIQAKSVSDSDATSASQKTAKHATKAGTGKEKGTGGKKEKRHHAKSSHTLTLEDVYSELKLSPDDVSESKSAYQKDFPSSAEAFLDQMGIWFNNALNYFREMEAKNSSGPKPSMYQ
eukprot:gb/GEZN01010814.1/.p1 GENE.gb/GEZN01010814.1/~~gb/GEZN01010814.1/.p1  ORF type:complete len:365 (-),score=58.94 gb/GEZN01010814.1/:114-1160(-)